MRALRADAVSVGDHKMVATCDAAMGGRSSLIVIEALQTCAHVLAERDARAAADTEPPTRRDTPRSMRAVRA